jgi:hypothetical protein
MQSLLKRFTEEEVDIEGDVHQKATYMAYFN